MNPWRSVRGLPPQAWVLFWATLINRAGTMVLPFLALYTSEELGWGAPRAGLAVAAFGLGALVVGPAAGKLSDKVGAMRVLRGALAFSGLMLLFFPLVRGFWPVLIMTFAWSVAGESFRPANLALLAGACDPSQRKAAFALNRLAVNLGMSVGPAAGGLLAMWSFKALFFVDGATSLLAALFLFFYAVPASNGRPSEAESGAPVSGAQFHDAPPPSAPVPSIALKDPRLLFFLAGLLPVAMTFLQLEAAYPLFLVRELKMAPSSFGFLLTLNTLLIITLEIPLNGAMERWPHRWALSLGTLLTGAGFGLTAFASGPWGIALTAVIWTFGEMILFPTASAFVADLAPESRRGSYMGLYTMTFSLAVLLGPATGTWMLEHLGGQALWATGFVACLLSAAWMTKVSVAERTAAVEGQKDGGL